ncbi:MAG: hypothetical protein KDJ48_01215 [Nitratireductor sp.]|nr:hypothetical protein [Nitratireductor sp.]MCB1457889.1 hypothetical protein [Nitratireductor sp.]
MTSKLKSAVTGLLALSTLVLSAGSGFARPDTRNYACAEVQAAVRQARAILMTTGPHTYDRIVSGQGQCGPTQRAFRRYAPTLDNPKCFVGYYCIEDPIAD